MIDFIYPGVPIQLLRYYMCSRPQRPHLPLPMNLLNKPHVHLDTPDRNRARAARFSVVRAKCPTPLDLAAPISYCPENHPPLTLLVYPMRTANRLDPAPISSPRGSILGFWG